MGVYIPRQVRAITSGSQRWAGRTHYSALNNRRSLIPIVTDGYWDRTPSYWYNTSKRKENDVVHAKLVDPFGSDQFIADCEITDSSSPYLGCMLMGTDLSNRYQAGTKTVGSSWVDLWKCFPGFTVGSYSVCYYSTSSRPVKVLNQATLQFNLSALRFDSDANYPSFGNIGHVSADWDSQGEYWKTRGTSRAEGAMIYLIKSLPDPRGLIDDDRGHARFELLRCGWEAICAWLETEVAFSEKWSWDRPDYSIRCKVFNSGQLKVDFDKGQLQRDVFLLDEPWIYQDRIDPMLLGKDTDFSGYWRNWLTQHALLDACEHIPRLNDNSISNVLEIVSFIYNLVVKHQIEIPKSLSSAWLAYRYQFTTSSLDAREAIDFVHRHMDLGSLDKGLTCYGSALTDYGGTTITCRCELHVTPKELGYLGRIWRALYTYGLQPNFYVVWDMIPYSFIVDWFIPLGDAFSVVDASRMYNSDNYTFEKIVYSLSYKTEKDGNNIRCYTRWAGSTPPELNAFYWFDKEGRTSGKTHVYRVLDALSLTIGRLKGGQ